MNYANINDVVTILPLAVLVVWASALLLLDVFLFRGRTKVTAGLAALGLAVSLLLSVLQIGKTGSAFAGMVSLDGFAVFLNVLFLGSGIFGVALAYDYLSRMNIQRGEYYIFLMFAISGMMLMAFATDLIVVFLALELLSIPLYVLSGFARPRLDSEESALKYFLLGAFASGFLVYGIALVFGGTGTTSLQGIVAAVQSGDVSTSLVIAGAGLILVGLGFKVGAVPFHMWTPDVYQGAPSTVTAFMAVGAKAGGFAALLRVFTVAFASAPLSENLTAVLWGIAALTMIAGNFLAISQQNIKRMLAYSSIAHAGFILMGFVPFASESVSKDSVAAALFYLLAFAVTSFGVWAVVIGLEQAEDDENGFHKGLNLSDYAGLGRKHRGMAAAMTVFMLSFTGLPPTLGFAGKLFLFRTAIEGGFMGLALIGVLTSLVSAFYYLRVVVIMYMHDGEPIVVKERWLNVTTIVAAVGTVGLSIFASPVFDWAAKSVINLF